MKKLITGLIGVLVMVAVSQAQVSRIQKEVEQHIKILKEDKDAKRRADSINELGRVAQIRTAFVKPAIPALVEALADPNADIRRSAVGVLAIANMDHERVVPPMVKLLAKTEDRQVRIAAATALGAMGGNANPAVAPLAEIKKEEDAKPRDDQDRQLLQAVNRSLQSIQASFKEQADMVIAMLRSNPNPDVRADSIDDVAKLAKTYPAYAGPAYTALVEAWIKDRDADVRKAVQEWIRTMKPDPKAIITPLIQMLTNRNEDKLNRVAAATMLGGMRGDAKDALPVLTELKGKEQDPQVLGAINFALRRIEAAVDDDQ